MYTYIHTYIHTCKINRSILYHVASKGSLCPTAKTHPPSPTKVASNHEYISWRSTCNTDDFCPSKLACLGMLFSTHVCCWVDVNPYTADGHPTFNDVNPFLIHGLGWNDHPLLYWKQWESCKTCNMGWSHLPPLMTLHFSSGYLSSFM